MSVNLFDLVKGQLTSSIIGKIGGLIGENETNTNSAIGKMLPSILGGLASKANTSSGPGEIFDLLNKGGHDGSIFGNLGDLLSGGDKTNSMMDTGTNLARSIFGGKMNSVMDVLSRAVGFGNRSSSSLMSILLPIVMGMIGKAKKDNNLDASGVARLLMDQGPYIKDKAPAGLLDTLGLGSLWGGAKKVVGNTADAGKRVVSGTADAGKRVVSGTADAGRRVASGTTEVAKSGGGLLKKLLPLALLLLLGILAWPMLRGCGAKTVEAGKNVGGAVVEGTKNVGGAVVDGAKDVGGAVVDGTKGAVGAVADGAGKVVDGAKNVGGKVVDGAKGAAGAVTDGASKVVDGAKDAAGAVAGGIKGAAAKLGQLFSFSTSSFGTFLKDPKADLKRAFLLDKVEFATGSANLRPSSKAQLDEVAKILNANKGVNIQLEGHTDNTGQRAANVSLSNKRAQSVKSYLTSKGVAANRMTTKGFGPDNPRFSNDDAAGRQKNRRTEMRVTKK